MSSTSPDYETSSPLKYLSETDCPNCQRCHSLAEQDRLQRETGLRQCQLPYCSFHRSASSNSCRPGPLQEADSDRRQPRACPRGVRRLKVRTRRQYHFYIGRKLIWTD